MMRRKERTSNQIITLTALGCATWATIEMGVMGKPVPSLPHRETIPYVGRSRWLLFDQVQPQQERPAHEQGVPIRDVPQLAREHGDQPALMADIITRVTAAATSGKGGGSTEHMQEWAAGALQHAAELKQSAGYTGSLLPHSKVAKSGPVEGLTRDEVAWVVAKEAAYRLGRYQEEVASVTLGIHALSMAASMCLVSALIVHVGVGMWACVGLGVLSGQASHTLRSQYQDHFMSTVAVHETDVNAARLAGEAGYDPRAGVSALRKLQARQGTEPGATEQLSWRTAELERKLAAD